MLVVMFTVLQTPTFTAWLAGLRDGRASHRILKRLVRLRTGHFGDVKFVDGIGEMRIDYGPGYRLYLVRRGNEIVVLLCGGDKQSQRRDIERAQIMAREV